MATIPEKYIGGYRIIGPPKKGGMASVYKAYDTYLERYVAIKLIHPSYEHSEDFLKRFAREAKVLAKLTHPNIVPIIDFGEYEGLPYLVMPFLAGGTIKDRIGKPFSWQDAVRVLLPIARALAYAHSQGIIHRDIKPSNIMFTDSGAPMLMDFGVARFLDSSEATSLTFTGQMVGTPEYMAPEQWLGSVSVQGDIYALGAVFYEMVTGHKPYIADTPAAVFLKAMNEPLPRPRMFIPGLPGKVEAVLYKAMAKKPEERYRDMQAFAKALESLIGQERAVDKAEIGTLSAITMAPQKGPVMQAAPSAQEGQIPVTAPTPKSVGRTRRFLFTGIPLAVILVVVAFACVGSGYAIYKIYPGLIKGGVTPTRVGYSQPTSGPAIKTATSIPVKTSTRAPAATATRRPTPTLPPPSPPTKPPRPTNTLPPPPPPPPTFTFAPAPKIWTFKADESMFCREGPDPSYRDNLTISPGESLLVLARWANNWLLLSIDRPDLTRSKCCWVGGKGTLNVDLSEIRLIDKIPDRFTCQLP